MRAHAGKLRRLLLVSHAADRSGAPLFLANLAIWLKKEVPDIEVDVLLKQTGELRSMFAAAGHCRSWRLEDTWPIQIIDRLGIWGKRRDRYLGHGPLQRWYQRSVLRWLQRRRYDLVFVNSFANAALIPMLADAIGRPVICRAPELESVVEAYCGRESVLMAIPRIQRFIAVSNIVTDYMVGALGIDRERISQIPGFYRHPDKKLPPREEIRKALGIPKHAFVVCGCGTISARKGTDLFLAIAQRLLTEGNRVEWFFIWMGEATDLTFLTMIRKEAVNSLALEHVRFIGKVDEPYEWFSASDVLALTSREDPFPLVAIEAAHAGLPIICFDGPVGTRELAEQGAVMLAEHFSTEDFAQRVLELSSDVAKHARLAQRAREVSTDYSIDRIGIRVLDLILSEIH